MRARNRIAVWGSDRALQGFGDHEGPSVMRSSGRNWRVWERSVLVSDLGKSLDCKQARRVRKKADAACAPYLLGAQLGVEVEGGEVGG